MRRRASIGRAALAPMQRAGGGLGVIDEPQAQPRLPPKVVALQGPDQVDRAPLLRQRPVGVHAEADGVERLGAAQHAEPMCDSCAPDPPALPHPQPGDRQHRLEVARAVRREPFELVGQRPVRGGRPAAPGRPPGGRDARLGAVREPNGRGSAGNAAAKRSQPPAPR